MYLESENIIIYTAQTVSIALDIIRQTKIDVAVLDYMLPELKGDELAKRIIQIDPEVKIFFISGYDIALEAIKKLNLSVYGVFRKPVDPKLIDKIANAEDYASFTYQIASISVENLYSNIMIQDGLIQNQHVRLI
jgi:DNA-binding NtrC family response regulator